MNTKPQELQPRTPRSPKLVYWSKGIIFFGAKSLEQIAPNILSQWSSQWMQVYKSFIQDSVQASRDLKGLTMDHFPFPERLAKPHNVFHNGPFINPAFISSWSGDRMSKTSSCDLVVS